MKSRNKDIPSSIKCEEYLRTNVSMWMKHSHQLELKGGEVVFQKGKKPWSPRNRKYKRFVIIGAITKKGWLYPGKVYNKGSITNEGFEGYVSKTLCPRLSGDSSTVIWDRYGRSGRAKNPTVRHFSPKARKSIENTGAKLLMLPPSGKYGNPIEMVFGDTKRIYEKKMTKNWSHV